MKKLFLVAALLGGIVFTTDALAANIRRCRNCGRKYDLSELSYTAKSWKIHYCCESCARKSGALK